MHIRTALLTLALGLGSIWPALGQTAPDTAGMIEALKPAKSRNLMVRPTAEAAPAASAALVTTAPTVPAAPASATAVSGAMVAGPAVTPPAPPPAGATPAPTAAAPSPSLSLAIQFEVNSARVRPESGPVLGNLVAALMSPDLQGNRFAIEGHTDASGPAARNLALSRDRAEEVRLFLVALGVQPSRLKAVGKGATEPVNPLNPLAPENRRVRVVTLE